MTGYQRAVRDAILIVALGVAILVVGERPFNLWVAGLATLTAGFILIRANLNH